MDQKFSVSFDQYVGEHPMPMAFYILLGLFIAIAHSSTCSPLPLGPWLTPLLPLPRFINGLTLFGFISGLIALAMHLLMAILPLGEVPLILAATQSIAMGGRGVLIVLGLCDIACFLSIILHNRVFINAYFSTSTSSTANFSPNALPPNTFTPNAFSADDFSAEIFLPEPREAKMRPRTREHLVRMKLRRDACS